MRMDTIRRSRTGRALALCSGLAYSKRVAPASKDNTTGPFDGSTKRLTPVVKQKRLWSTVYPAPEAHNCEARCVLLSFAPEKRPCDDEWLAVLLLLACPLCPSRLRDRLPAQTYTCSNCTSKASKCHETIAHNREQLHLKLLYMSYITGRVCSAVGDGQRRVRATSWLS